MIMIGESPNQEQLKSPVDLMRLAIAFKRRRLSIVAVTIFGAIGGVGVSKALVPPVFEARAVIECERCSRPEFGDRELATLQETVKLPAHLEIIRQKLGIDAPLDRIGHDIDVSASIESRLIQITGRAKTAEMAAGMANIIVDAFLETRLQIERDKLMGHLHTLERDAEKARKAVNDAREQYDQFRKDNNIADLPAERQAAIQEAARLRSEAAIARGEEQAARARVRALERVTTKEPPTAVLQQVEELPSAKRLSKATIDLGSAQARFTAEHPSVKVLTDEVDVLKGKVAASNDAIATGRTVGRNPQWDLAKQGILQATVGQEAASTLESTYEQLAQNAALAAARLSKLEGQASDLFWSVQHAERHLAAIESDKKIAADAARSPTTELRILTPARPPMTPAKSTRRVAGVLGLFFGCIVAALATVLYELRGFRIRTAEELAFWGQGPVVASSRWPTSAEALDELVSDILAALRGTKGTTMLVGAGTGEAAFVEHLVECIRERMRLENSAHEFDGCSIEAISQLGRANALRRAVHAADRVLLFVSAGRHSAFALRAFINKVAFPSPVGFVLVDLHEDHVKLPDLVGDVRAFRNIRPSRAKRWFGRIGGRSGLRPMA